MILTFFFITFLLLWGAFLYFTYQGMKHLRPIDTFDCSHFKNQSIFPKLSIVIAVKNEEERVTETLTTLLESEYPHLEVIIVNDRSTDSTKEKIERIACQSSKLKAIHLETLPNGWLGKVHALAKGYSLASGEFILFTDGDVSIPSDVIYSTLSIMKEEQLDHLTVMPQIPCQTFFLKLLVMTSKLLFTVSGQTWRPIEERPLAATRGIGPFNMVRKDYFDKTEGFEWFRLDISDDIALSHLMAKDGGRSLYLHAGKNGPIFPWYRDAIHMMHGLEKNIVGGFTNYKLSLLFLVSFFALCPLFIPLLALASTTTAGLATVLICIGLTLIFSLKIRKYLPDSIWVIITFPLGIALLTFIMLRAAFICFKNQGIYWSGTFYPLNELKSNIRIRLGLW